MIIRPMTASDCRSIDQAFLAQQWPSRQATLERYLQEQSRGLRQVFVAEDSGQIAGYATLIPHAKAGPFKKNGYPEITDLNVFQNFQRQGIGAKLLQAAEEQAKTFSSVITIGVGLHSGYGPAQRLYLKNGYIPDGSGSGLRIKSWQWVLLVTIMTILCFIFLSPFDKQPACYFYLTGIIYRKYDERQC